MSSSAWVRSAAAIAALSLGCNDSAGMDCVAPEGQAQSYTVTYPLCAVADAGDASPTGDAGQCFYYCAEACARLKPASLVGTGACIGAPVVDAGIATATCATGVGC